MALDERRALLEDRLGQQHSSIRFSDEIVGDGSAFLKQAYKLGLEGIIAKRRDAPYRPGRGGDWLKIKCVQSETFLIIGYEPSAAALGGIGRVLLAARRGKELVHVGSVGTGFTVNTATALRKQLTAMAVEGPSLAMKAKGVVWVTPTLPVEIAFRGWTHDGQLRHASYKGIREVADAADVPNGRHRR